MPTSVVSHRPNYTKALEEDKNRLPTPSHRHSAPSAPWPWIDIHDEIDPVQLESKLDPVPPLCDHKTCDGCWKGYPQSRFPNWTPRQVERSKIADAISNYDSNTSCKIHHVDVNTQGFFTDAGEIVAPDNDREATWDLIIHEKRPDNLRVRALFLENLSGPVLQMLGAKFNIEPFFWSSSINWIPSRFQEDPQPGKGDHITITLTFLKSMEGLYHNSAGTQSAHSISTVASTDDRLTVTEQMIDTQAPLRLRSSRRILILDLLSVHLIRNVTGSTIISYHPTMKHPTTTAQYLHDRIRYAGQSVYWQSIFQKSPDPTFVLLTFVWHAMYAWDEALQHLYNHICWLETKVINTSNMQLTQELHIIRAHHLHYSSLLEDFEKTVKFIRDTHNPAMESYSKAEREYSAHLMKRECQNLLSEINRLEMGRRMQDKRLKNVMNLVFSRVNIDDSARMRQMTEAAVKDSAAVYTFTFCLPPLNY
ncbi:putative corA-like Mg2+ transporter protein [Lyophyllum shimeji]|uniref:CorA-like Mg2+ transporter protein n=1 Tax=Lyophyllum shimeji TaxID=47721 RepID=A0A9P3PQQ9_LYOSH|nr:putative corA-like Mg2+ transporter protein [Lyophyllum shimeji]